MISSTAWAARSVCWMLEFSGNQTSTTNWSRSFCGKNSVPIGNRMASTSNPAARLTVTNLYFNATPARRP